jgi:hypothetical protein
MTGAEGAHGLVRPGPGGARGRNGDPAPGVRVVAKVRRQLLSLRPRKGVMMSIGAGKTIVVDCDEPSSSSVCR